MAPFIRCQRRRIGRFAAIGLSFMLVPLVIGLAILFFLPANMFTWAGATICFLFTFLFSYPTLRMFHWIETDGDIIRGKRFFTRLIVERGADDLAELRAALGQLAERGRDPALGAIHAFNYQLGFHDRLLMFLSCIDMNDTDRFVEAVIAEPVTGLRLPVVLGGLHLGAYTNDGDERVGRSYAYFGQGHLTLTLYLYGLGEPVTEGIDDARLRSEFEDAKAAVSAMRSEESSDQAPKVSESVAVLGDDPEAPRALSAVFEFDLGSDVAESRLYVLAWRGHVLKVRATMPASYRSTWGPALSRLEAALGKLLA